MNIHQTVEFLTDKTDALAYLVWLAIIICLGVLADLIHAELSRREHLRHIQRMMEEGNL